MTLSNLGRAAVISVLEELYLKDNVIPDQIFRDNPALGLIPKSTDGGGRYRHVPIRYARPQGGAISFATAQANGVGSKRAGFDVTWISQYQVGGIDGDVIDDARANETILIDHVKNEVDGMIDNLRDNIAFGLFRNQGNSRGRISDVTTTTITLTNPADTAQFEVGMYLVSATTDGTTGSVKAGSTAIGAIDRDAGTLVAAGAANWSTGMSSIANNDYLFRAGDFDSTSTGLAGFSSWVPATAPSATTFFGVDRSVDAVRLGGVRYPGTGMPLEQALINGCAQVQRWKKGASIDICFLNPLKFAALEIGLEGRKRVQEIKGEGPAAHIGYKALMVSTPTGDIPVIADPSCQTDTAWLLKKNSWCLESVGDLVRVIDEDDNSMLRQAAADGYEMRIKSRANLWCNEPGANCRVTI